MRPVSIAGVGRLPSVLADAEHDEAELVQVVTAAALADAGVPRDRVGFVCSGSSDYVMGRPFSFTMALDGIGPWPPVRESHVEMDGAWALYEAWVRLQHGDVDVALVYAYGKASLGPVDAVLSLQLDPYVEAPLAPPPLALAALQARALLLAGRTTEAQLAAVVARHRRAACDNPELPACEVLGVEALLDHPYAASPLRAHDGPVRTDGAAAVVLVAGGDGPRISGFAHAIDPIELGLRDLCDAPSARAAFERAGGGRVDVAELHAPYAPQEVVLRDALGLGDTPINPRGGTLLGDTPMVSGLERVIEAARHVRSGARRALAHATAGPCLQQNLVCLLEAP